MINQEQAEKIRAALLAQIEKMPKEQAEGLKEQVLAATPEELEQFVSKSGVGGGSGGEGGCIFCKIASGEIKTFKVYESQNILAFLDINPTSKGNTLVIPKKHFQYLFQIPNEVVFEIFSVIKRLSPLLINSVKAKGITTIFHQGKDQTVPHFNVSLIPRFENDTLEFEQPRKKGDEKELLELSTEISRKINKEIEEEKANKIKEEQLKEIKEEEQKKEISFFKKRIPR